MDIVILGVLGQPIKIPDNIRIKEVIQAGDLTDDHTLQTESEAIYFDYLLIRDFSLIKSDRQNLLLSENGLPVVNFYRQTACVNIFYVDSPEAYDRAIGFIIEGD